MANQTYKSGCACGAVQLEITGEPAVQAYCHCESCRSWFAAPVNAAALWPVQSVKVVKGADNLGLYKKTEASHRQFCRTCGAAVMVGHPGRSGHEMAVIGTLSALVGYAVGAILKLPPTL